MAAAKYTLNRNYTLCTTRGSLTFVKGEPTLVPPELEKEVLMIGGEIVEGDAPDIIEDEKPKLPQLAPDERKAQVMTAFEMLIERNDPKDFTGAGIPTVKSVEGIVGFSVDRGEINGYWTEMRERESE